MGRALPLESFFVVSPRCLRLPCSRHWTALVIYIHVYIRDHHRRSVIVRCWPRKQQFVTSQTSAPAVFPIPRVPGKPACGEDEETQKHGGKIRGEDRRCRCLGLRERLQHHWVLMRYSGRATREASPRLPSTNRGTKCLSCHYI